jgi:hypothetical protein
LIIANSTPLISISRHLAPFGIITWKVKTYKGPFLEFGPSSFVGTREVDDCRPSDSRFSFDTAMVPHKYKNLLEDFRRAIETNKGEREKFAFSQTSQLLKSKGLQQHHNTNMSCS